MKCRLLPALFLASAALVLAQPAKPFGLVIHGGAGVILRQDLSREKEAEYRAKLAEARDAGYAVLARGGTALDAVVATITILEDSPLFNAGKGAVFDADALCELDASIMDGRTLAAGAIAGVQHIKNPITLARAVMEKSEHVMLMGEGAEKFAKQQGFEFVPNEYFQTDFRREQLKKAKEKEATKRPTSQFSPIGAPSVGQVSDLTRLTPDGQVADLTYLFEEKHGTVGCVALDQAGNLAAGTSTGGMTNKKFGRIGDAPIIGAGTYASNATCAVSATGWGEFFIRVGVARDIAAQMEYKGVSLSDAAAASIAKVGKMGGDGGVIGIDRAGHIAMTFNSPGMYRGYKLSTGGSAIEIFGDRE
jgi:beta-aspartyl-peptidase (threonine type)